MCGDTCCPSCGPAQGNWKCPICGSWASDGCDHIDDNGDIQPEFKAEADAIAIAEAEADSRYAADLEAEAALAETHWRDQPLDWCCTRCHTINGHADRNCVNCNRRME
jgi:rubredoxin